MNDFVMLQGDNYSSKLFERRDNLSLFYKSIVAFF
jgi:hypothetical protein